MGEHAPDLAAYERYWQPRRRRMLARVADAWKALVARLPGFRRGSDEGPDEPPWLEPSLVPTGPRGPVLADAVALEPPEDDDWNGDVVAYPKQL